MKLKQPATIKEKLLKQKQAATMKEIAAALKMSNHTVAKVFGGGAVRPSTIRKIANVLDLAIGDIATFVGGQSDKRD